MKALGIVSLILNLIATVSFLAGILLFAWVEKATLGTVFICVGFVFMGVGIYLSRKEIKQQKLRK